MILPKGQPIHENLNTSYTNFEELLQDLKTNQLTGYVRVIAWQYEGVLFCDTGNLVNVVEESEGRRRVGLAAFESVKGRAKEKDATVSVYALEGELIALIAGSAQRAALYEQLTNDLTTLDRLMTKLQKESHTGHIEVAVNAGGAGMIFLQNGALAGAFYSANGNSTIGANALTQLASHAQTGASFSVYRSDPTNALGQEYVRLEQLEIWQMFLVALENAVDKTAGSGAFGTAFKRGCLDHVNEYPFLDPFIGDLEFKNGRLAFQGQANAAQFNTSLARVLTSLASKLNPAAAKSLRDALKSAADARQAQARALGIADALSEFLGKD